ncbi:50S ribosomal protein L21 [Aquimarina sp. U1-2]|uniref:50S ribosomal protein L21 n=1 Tax=Aquimarina sp. U1-2 TaxID=2823141 RepID=UPI001AECE6A2|nr:50S ribosomal protein L21 [Aquimarina sp. U1-2]MBP2831367.1 50S ribosomal protein L21 [Aquimarina sp. U1-2]
MYAIVEIAGQQFKVAKDQKVFVHRLAGEEGDKVSFDKVLLAADGDSITLGAPAIDGAQVGAKITRHLKGDKVIVFKKKRRKGYRVKNGHRQALTEIVIESIVTSGAKKAAPKKETKKAEPKAEKEVKAAAPKTEAKPKTAALKKEEAPKGKTEDLSTKTVAELKEMAKAAGISGISSMKKAELIEALQAK